eukprot:c5239_g1_i1 orf=192-644(-)
MMMRPTFSRVRTKESQADAERCKELERKVAEMEKEREAKKVELEKVKRDLEEKVCDLQRGLQEIQRKQAAMEKAMQEETLHAFEEVRHKLEETETARAQGLVELQSKMEERCLITTRLYDDIKAAFSHLSQTFETSYNNKLSKTTTVQEV